MARAQVHLPASAVRPRPLASVTPLRRGSFALGTGRSPMSNSRVPCMWKRLAGRPTGGAGPSPPTSKRCNAPSFRIGQSLAPWIIRPRYGPQPDEQAACGSNLIYVRKRLAGRPTGGAGPSPPTSKRRKAPSFRIGQSLAPWIIRPRYGPQPDEQAACALHVEAPGGSPHGWRGPKSTYQQAL